MRLNARGARKALVVAVMGCMGTILAARQHKEQSTARTIAAKKDGRAEIDAHAAEWLKESDVPSVAVAYIEDRKVAWTEVYGEQSPGVAATGKTERIERVRLCQCPRCVAQRRDRVETVLLVVAGRRATKHCQRFIDVFCLCVSGNGCAGCVGLFNDVDSVVSIDRSASRGGFFDSSAEGIVFEATNCPAVRSRPARLERLCRPRRV